MADSQVPAQASPFSNRFASLQDDPEDQPESVDAAAESTAVTTTAAAASADGTSGTDGSTDGGSVPGEYHELNGTWTLWHDSLKKRTNAYNWSGFLNQIYTFKTVEDFWRVFDNVSPPSTLSAGSDYHLFRQGIQPTWEDITNRSGGKWLIVLPKKLSKENNRLDDWWLKTAMSMVGEAFGEHSEYVCGVVISIRKQGDKIAIWTKEWQNQVAQVSIGRIWKEDILGNNIKVAMTYQAHEDAMRKNSSFDNTARYEL